MRYLLEEQLEEAETSLANWLDNQRIAAYNVAFSEGGVARLKEALKRLDDEQAAVKLAVSQEGDDRE